METVRSVLESAGGFVAVAKGIGAKSDETVRMWAVKNRVPARWISKVSDFTGKSKEWFWELYEDEWS